MKKLFLITLALFLAIVGSAQDVTVTTTAGNLRANLITAAGGENNLGSIVKLKINGTLNAQDFTDIKAGYINAGNRIDPAVLSSVDLSGITAIENNEIPASAFYQHKALANIIFPSGKIITKIGENAFGTGGGSYAGFTSIVLPEGLTTIGANAFYGQSNVTSLSLPSTLTRVEDGAFRNFSKMTSLVLPESLTYIGGSAFYGWNNEKMTSLTIPSSVEYIGSQAFALWLYVEKITFAPRNGRAIEISGDRTFRSAGYYPGDAGKYTAFEFPDNTTITYQTKGDGILYQFFNASKTINEVKNLPQTITQIGSQTFANTNITSITIPSTVTSIGAMAFQNTKLTNIVLPNSVTSVEDNAFSEVITLASITLSNSLKSIGSYAFSGTIGLEKLELPTTLTTIGNYAFQNMTNLKTLIVNNPEPVILKISSKVFDGIPKGADAKACTLYVPAQSIDPTTNGYNAENDYSIYDLWKDFMPNIKAIGSNAVANEIKNFDDITVEKSSTATITLTATVEGDRTVTYSIEDGKTAVATLSSGVLTIVGEGTAQITAQVAGNNDYAAAQKMITLTVLDYTWLQDVAIAVSGTTAKVVGPAELVAKFTKFYVGSTATDGNSADISAVTGEVELKATTANDDVVKLKYKK